MQARAAGALALCCVCGEPPELWTPDQWWHARVDAASGFVLAQAHDATEVWGDLVRPTSPAERNALMNQRRGSCPGPSGWKLHFLKVFPQWA